MCNSCGYTPCKCNSNGCPINLDFSCVFYHKSNNQISLLTGLGLSNGSTLQLFAETVDTYIQQMKVSDWTLLFLRENNVVNSLQQFGVAVDTTFSDLQGQIDDMFAELANMGYLGEVTGADPTAENGQYWFRTDLDQLFIKLNGSTRQIPIV